MTQSISYFCESSQCFLQEFQFVAKVIMIHRRCKRKKVTFAQQDLAKSGHKPDMKCKLVIILLLFGYTVKTNNENQVQKSDAFYCLCCFLLLIIDFFIQISDVVSLANTRGIQHYMVTGFRKNFKTATKIQAQSKYGKNKFKKKSRNLLIIFIKK